MILTLDKIQNLRGRVALDVETSGGHQPWLGELVGLGIWSPDNNVYGYVPCGEGYSSRDEIIAAVKTWQPGTYLIGHNLKYELHWLGFTKEELKQYSVFDSMVAEHLLNEELQKDLGSLESRHLLTRSKKAMLEYAAEHYGGIKNIREWPVKLSADYCQNDCRITYDVAALQVSFLKAEGLDKLFKKQMAYLKELYGIEARGVVLDKQQLYENMRRAHSILQAVEEDLRIALKKYNLKPLRTYNSPKAVSNLLYVDLGISKPECPPSLRKSPKAKAYASTCTAKEILSQLAHPVARLILEWKSIKILMGYMKAYIKFEDAETSPLYPHGKKQERVTSWLDGLVGTSETRYGIIHSSFNQAGTVTGRLSSTRPNLQQVKAKYVGKDRDTAHNNEGFGVRSVFCARDGYVLLSIDYKQMEVVVFAALSRDPKLLEIVKTGQDAHALTAVEMYGVMSDNNRKNSKTINFGVLYGLGIPGLAQLLRCSEDEAANHMAKYLGTFAMVRPWMTEVANELAMNNYVTYWSGRRRRIPNRNLHYRGVNALVQGGCADIVADAAVAVGKYLDKQGDGEGIVAIIHDEFLIELKWPTPLKSIDILPSIENAPDEIKKKIKDIGELMAVPEAVGIPLLTDPEYGHRWNASENDDRRDFFSSIEMHNGTSEEQRKSNEAHHNLRFGKPKLRKADRATDDFTGFDPEGDDSEEG